MPDDQLIRFRDVSDTGRDEAGASVTPRDVADGVLAVLAGIPLREAAARLCVRPDDLADAVEVYKAAGYAAIRAPADQHGSWYQARIQFTDWDTAEQAAATSLGPRLAQMRDHGVLVAWWFMRKAPCWRLRVQGSGNGDPKTDVAAALDDLLAAGLIQRWQESIYEPESAAFGGTEGMNIAHSLFHDDSRCLLEYVRSHLIASRAPDEPTIGRRELSVLLCSALMHGARRDWFERGDVWHRVVLLRPLPPGISAISLRGVTHNLRVLLTADPRPAGTLFGAAGPLRFANPWSAAFERSGQALAAAASGGRLERGLRDILAHHVIFHWNRLGLAATAQAVLARAARDIIMDQTPDGR